MKYLLDTHILLWAAAAPSELPKVLHEMIEHPDSELFFSAASIWEIAIKQLLKRDDFRIDAHIFRRELLEHDYHELPISTLHAAMVQDLPALHKDPFDRILVAQATLEGISLLTADKMVSLYPGPIQFYGR